MRATLANQYRSKNGNRVYVYTVSGTTKEIAAYKKAKAERLGVDESELKTDDKGNQLYHFSPNLAQGRKAEKVFTLAVSFGGKIVIDTTDAEMVRDNEIDQLMKAEEAKLLVQMKYGLVTAGARATATAAPSTNQPATTGNDEKNTETDELDKITSQLQQSGSGTENLNDSEEDSDKEEIIDETPVIAAKKAVVKK